jgi:hypothetical protein
VGASRTPTRIPLSSFNAQFDIIGGILQPSNNEQLPNRTDRPEPVVELFSPNSGIRLAFDTNRMFSNSLSSAQCLIIDTYQNKA